MLSSPWLAMFLTLILCLAWMRIINFLTDKGIVARSFSRKVIHIGTGPIFLLCWMLFPENPISKYLAAVVPFLLVLVISIVATAVESITPSNWDNLTVPGVALMTSLLLF